MRENEQQELAQLLKEEKWDEIITEVRKIVTANKRAFTNPIIKKWCSKRWINIFLDEAIHDTVALKSAEKKIGRKRDKRSDRQKIAERYLKGDNIREWATEMPKVERLSEIKKASLLFSPGLLTGMLPVRAFQTPFPIVEEKLNMRILRSDSHPMRGCDDNIQDLMNAIEKGIGFTSDVKFIPEEKGQPLEDFFGIGYSKGMPDLLVLLIKHPELKTRTRCLFNWGGAVGGSYLADDMYESIKDMDLPMVETFIKDFLIRMFPIIDRKGLLRRFEEFQIKEAIWDITTMAREKFLKAHLAEIDAMDIPIFTITGSTSVLQVPYFQIQGCMVLNKYDANNDMQLTQSEALLDTPMATHLAMVNAHHWDMSYDPFPKLMRFGSNKLDHPFPKEAAATAMVLLGVELGLID